MVEKKSPLKWKFNIKDTIYSPIISKGIIYVGSSTGYLYAIEITTGEIKWKYDSYGKIYYSPAICNEIVYFGSDNNLIALDVNNQKSKWQYRRNNLSYKFKSRR